MKTPILLAAIACLLPLTQAQALTVVPSDSGAVLAGTILGGGITLSGVPGYVSGVSGASGSFAGGLASGIGIDSGLILTTGLASSAVGPNTSESTSGGGNHTQLSFSFTTAGGDLFFNYVFASEEYVEFVNSSFNDSFEFLLDGVNIALIPGTATPVTINNVNQLTNSSLFNDNSVALPAPFNIAYDGFTDVFQAKALGIGAGTHTIVLVIKDVTDSIYDSAVFIQAGSFSDVPVDPGTPGNGVPDSGATLALLGSSFLGLSILRRRLIG